MIPVRSWLAWLARPDSLRRAESVEDRYVVLGVALACAGVLAGVSGYFTVRLATNLPWPIAAPIAVGWGIVVLNVNRWLSVSFRPGGAAPSRIFRALVRLAVVLLLGCIIATPVVLAAFRSEIDQRLAVQREQNAQITQTKLGEANSAIVDLKSEQTRLEGVVTGRSNPAVANDPVVREATVDYNQALADYAKAQNEAACELSGTCGTSVPGVGDGFRAKQVLVAEARAELDRAQARLNQVSSETAARLNATVPSDEVAQAQGQLNVVQTELETTEARRDALVVAADRGPDAGLFVQLTVLRDIADASGAVRWLQMVVFVAFLVSVEALPLGLRTVSFGGPARVYRRRDPTTHRQKVERFGEASVRATNRVGMITPRPPERGRPPWRAITDGIGGAFDLFGGTYVRHTELPPFEATLAADVDRLCRVFAGGASTSQGETR